MPQVETSGGSNALDRDLLTATTQGIVTGVSTSVKPYVPRWDPPKSTDKCWIKTTYGGYSPYVLINASNGQTIPNCTGYCWGRWREILGKNPWSITGNAQDWYNFNDGYARGKTPKLGAVVCWGARGQYGHVAIVEQINSDGSYKISQSGWSESGGTYFKLSNVDKYGNSDWDGSASRLQGYIYLPGGAYAQVNKLEDFVKEAKKHIGEGPAWSYKTSPLASGQPWCAAFVTSVARTVGVAGQIIPISNSSSTFAREGVRNGWGEWFPGPAHGKTPIPKPGDILTFYNTFSLNRPDQYDADHVGIVVEVNGGSLTTVEGNAAGGPGPLNSRVATYKYQISSPKINGYYRPNWDAVGGGDASSMYGVALAPLYNSEYTRADGLIREVSYVDTAKLEPSIKSSNIKLSTMNYTQLLAAAFDVLAEQYGGTIGAAGGTADVSALDAVPRQITEYFMKLGFSAAVGIGISGNVYRECGYKIGAYGVDNNGYYSGGMIQWNDGWGGFTMMKNYVGPNWATNLTGQLDFLWHMLNHVENNTRNLWLNRHLGTKGLDFVPWMSTIPNTLEGAKHMADVFTYAVENGADNAYMSKLAQQEVERLWPKVIPILSNPTANVEEDKD